MNAKKYLTLINGRQSRQPSRGKTLAALLLCGSYFIRASPSCCCCCRGSCCCCCALFDLWNEGQVPIKLSNWPDYFSILEESSTSQRHLYWSPFFLYVCFFCRYDSANALLGWERNWHHDVHVQFAASDAHGCPDRCWGSHIAKEADQSLHWEYRSQGAASRAQVQCAHVSTNWN